MIEQLVDAWLINNRVNLLIANLDAEVRGSILLTLKQTGFKLNDQLRWGIWDWQYL